MEARKFMTFTDYTPLVFAFRQKLEKCTPHQFGHLDFVGQFMTDVRYVARRTIQPYSKLRKTSFQLYGASSVAEGWRGVKSMHGSGIRFVINENGDTGYRSIVTAVYCNTAISTPRSFLTKPFSWAIFDLLYKQFSLAYLGIRATAKLIAQRYVWFNKDCRSWAWACQRTKISRHVTAPRRKFATLSRRFEHVHIDIIVPVELPDGKRYCLICINRFSRWSFLLENQEAETVAKTRLWRFIRFGVPLQFWGRNENEAWT